MKNKYIKLLCAFVLSLLVFGSVEAKGVVKVDQELNEKGEVDSSRVLIGNNVTTEENVDGISLVAANNASIKGEAPYALYVGNIITIESSIANDLFVVGNNVNITSDAKIDRDIYAFASDMKINSQNVRNVRFIGNTLDIRGVTITGNLYADSNEILVDENTTVEGKITCYDYTVIEGKGKAKIGKIVEKESSGIERISLWERVYTALKSSIALFIVMALVLYILPKFKTKMDKETLDVEGVLKTIAKGLFVLIVVPMGAMIALFTGILAPLSLIAISLYAILCYLAKGITAYIIANKIMTKYKKDMNPYISLLIGIPVIYLLGLVPYVGSLITIISLLYGIGFVYKLIKTKIKA